MVHEARARFQQSLCEKTANIRKWKELSNVSHRMNDKEFFILKWVLLEFVKTIIILQNIHGNFLLEKKEMVFFSFKVRSNHLLCSIHRPCSFFLFSSGEMKSGQGPISIYTFSSCFARKEMKHGCSWWNFCHQTI